MASKQFCEQNVLVIPRCLHLGHKKVPSCLQPFEKQNSLFFFDVDVDVDFDEGCTGVDGGDESINAVDVGDDNAAAAVDAVGDLNAFGFVDDCSPIFSISNLLSGSTS